MTDDPSAAGPASPPDAAGWNEQEVRETAYYLWEQEGRPEGKDRAHYFQAEALLRARHASRPSMMPRVDGKPGNLAQRTNGVTHNRPGRLPHA